MSQQSSRSEFWAFWPQKMPASGWGSLWELSSFVPWFSTFVFRNVPGTVSECVVICWFKRNSSNLDRASEMRDSRNAGLYPVELLGQFFSDSAFNLFKNLCDIFLVNSRNGRVSWLAVPRMFLLCFSCNGCQLSFISQRCHVWREKCYAVMKTELGFYLLIKLSL